jgi:hypothetical protein
MHTPPKNSKTETILDLYKWWWSIEDYYNISPLSIDRITREVLDADHDAQLLEPHMAEHLGQYICQLRGCRSVADNDGSPSMHSLI